MNESNKQEPAMEDNNKPIDVSHLVMPPQKDDGSYKSWRNAKVRSGSKDIEDYID